MIRLALRNYGGTWESWEEELTVPRLLGMAEELTEHPPLHVLLKAGFRLDVDRGAFTGEEAVNRMLAMCPGGDLNLEVASSMELAFNG